MLTNPWDSTVPTISPKLRLGLPGTGKLAKSSNNIISSSIRLRFKSFVTETVETDTKSFCSIFPKFCFAKITNNQSHTN